MMYLLAFFAGLVIGSVIMAVGQPAARVQIVYFPPDERKPQSGERVMAHYPGLGWTNATYEGGGRFRLERYNMLATNVDYWIPE